MDKVTLTYAIFVFLISVFSVILALKTLFKKILIKSLNTSECKKNKLYQHKKMVTTILRIILATYIIVVLVFILIPSIIDLPRIFTGNYEISMCTIQDSYEYKTDLWVHLITDKGKNINLMVLDRSYEQDKQYLVYYLPHIKYGTLVPI
ncbi:MAG: hypothetical protein E7508_02250 [Ruminococcus sp.]|nr:hypothetical protein [Ruminococcus sp.]